MTDINDNTEDEMAELANLTAYFDKFFPRIGQLTISEGFALHMEIAALFPTVKAYKDLGRFRAALRKLNLITTVTGFKEGVSSEQWMNSGLDESLLVRDEVTSRPAIEELFRHSVTERRKRDKNRKSAGKTVGVQQEKLDKKLRNKKPAKAELNSKK